MADDVAMSDVIDSDADITTSEAINQHAEAQQTSTNFPQHESSAPTGPTQARNRFSPSNLDGTTANWQRLLIEVRDFRHELIDATNKRIAYEKIMDEKRAEDALAAQETPAEKAIRETSDEPTVVDREEPIPFAFDQRLLADLADFQKSLAQQSFYDIAKEIFPFLRNEDDEALHLQVQMVKDLDDAASQFMPSRNVGIVANNYDVAIVRGLATGLSSLMIRTGTQLNKDVKTAVANAFADLFRLSGWDETSDIRSASGKVTFHSSTGRSEQVKRGGATRIDHQDPSNLLAREEKNVDAETTETGLKNLGNTCYLNTLLWHLESSPGFMLEIVKPPVEPQTGGAQGAVEREFVDILRELLPALRAGNRAESISHLKRLLRNMDGNSKIEEFREKKGYREQQDPMELFRKVVQPALDDALASWKFLIKEMLYCVRCGVMRAGFDSGMTKSTHMLHVRPPHFSDKQQDYPDMRFVARWTESLTWWHAFDDELDCTSCRERTFHGGYGSIECQANMPVPELALSLQLIKKSGYKVETKTPIPQGPVPMIGLDALMYFVYVGQHVGKSLHSGHYQAAKRLRLRELFKMDASGQPLADMKKWDVYNDSKKIESVSTRAVESLSLPKGQFYTAHLVPLEAQDYEALANAITQDTRPDTEAAVRAAFAADGWLDHRHRLGNTDAAVMALAGEIEKVLEYLADCLALLPTPTGTPRPRIDLSQKSWAKVGGLIPAGLSLPVPDRQQLLKMSTSMLAIRFAMIGLRGTCDFYGASHRAGRWSKRSEEERAKVLVLGAMTSVSGLMQSAMTAHIRRHRILLEWENAYFWRSGVDEHATAGAYPLTDDEDDEDEQTGNNGGVGGDNDGAAKRAHELEDRRKRVISPNASENPNEPKMPRIEDSHGFSEMDSDGPPRPNRRTWKKRVVGRVRQFGSSIADRIKTSTDDPEYTDREASSSQQDPTQQPPTDTTSSLIGDKFQLKTRTRLRPSRPVQYQVQTYQPGSDEPSQAPQMPPIPDSSVSEFPEDGEDDEDEPAEEYEDFDDGDDESV